MTKITASQTVTAALTENPGQTAKELGMNGVTMNRLVKAGVVEVAANRRTGERGRPALVYILPGQEIDTAAEDQRNVERARGRVAAHRRYEAMSRAVVEAHNTYGYGSDEHVAAKLDRYDTFPIVPDLPTSTDYELAGIVQVGATVADEDPADDDEDQA
jgi:hypothetical protein